MKKIFFRADASNEIGYGHFIRTLALADMLKENFECTFFTQDPSEFQRKEVDKVCKLVSLPCDDSKFDIFLSYLTGEEIVFLDNYFFTSEYQGKVKSKGCKLVCLGSNDRHYYADIVLNYTNLNPKDFSTESYTKIFCGLEYVILREPFYQYNEFEKNNIVIVIGGSDQFGYSERFIKIIREILPSYPIQVISTDSMSRDRVESMNRQGVNVTLNLTSSEMAMAFAKARISIVSASTVVMEALSQQSSVITGYYVENQINLYNTLIKSKYVWPIGDFSHPECENLIHNAVMAILSGERKKSYHAYNTKQQYKTLFYAL